jgi:hypothetical protein
LWLRIGPALHIIVYMTNCDLPSGCQSKFDATSNCIACGVWVDAVAILRDIVRCADDASCSHHALCASEAARCAGDLQRGAPVRSRLMERLRQMAPPALAAFP